MDEFVIQHFNYLDVKLKLAYAEHSQVKNIISDSEITRPRTDSTVKSVSIEGKTQSSTYTMSNKTSFSTTTEDDVQVTVNNITKQLSLNEIEKNVFWTNNERS